MISNLYWHYPALLRKIANYIIKSKTTQTLKVSRNSHGEWCFNYPPAIWNEVVGDTGPALDQYYTRLTGQEPEVGDKLTLVVSIEPLPHQTTELHWQCDDGTGGAYYQDRTLMEPLWLCGLVPVLFPGEGHPEVLHCEVTAR